MTIKELYKSVKGVNFYAISPEEAFRYLNEAMERITNDPDFFKVGLVGQLAPDEEEPIRIYTSKQNA